MKILSFTLHRFMPNPTTPPWRPRTPISFTLVNSIYKFLPFYSLLPGRSQISQTTSTTLNCIQHLDALEGPHKASSISYQTSCLLNVDCPDYFLELAPNLLLKFSMARAYVSCQKLSFSSFLLLESYLLLAWSAKYFGKTTQSSFATTLPWKLHLSNPLSSMLYYPLQLASKENVHWPIMLEKNLSSCLW